MFVLHAFVSFLKIQVLSGAKDLKTFFLCMLSPAFSFT